MNGVRGFLSRTVTGSASSSSSASTILPAPAVTESPTEIENSTGWIPQISSVSAPIPITPAPAAPANLYSSPPHDPTLVASNMSTNQAAPSRSVPAIPGSSNDRRDSKPETSRTKSRTNTSTPPLPPKRTLSSSPKWPSESRKSSLPPVPGPSTPSTRSRSATVSNQYPSARSVGLGWNPPPPKVTTQDDLIISLLVSQAVLDSRNFQILSAEEVEELKREHSALSKRLAALVKRVATETKMRDAAAALRKLNVSTKRGEKPPADPVQVANAKVEAAHRELHHTAERATDIQRRLLEHRAAVLSVTVKNSEKGSASDTGDESETSTASTLSGELSPVSTARTSVSATSRSRFEGAHLFAGHADAVIPGTVSNTPISPHSPFPSSASLSQLATLKDQLAAATAATLAAKRSAAESSREMTLLNLEKNEMETNLGLQIQISEDTIAGLESQVQRMGDLEGQLRELRNANADLEARHQASVDELQFCRLKISALESQMSEADAARTTMAAAASASLAERDNQIAQMRSQWDNDVARLRSELEMTVSASGGASRETLEELEAGREAILDLARAHRVVLPLRVMTLPALMAALNTHVGEISAKTAGHEEEKMEWNTERKRLDEDLRRAIDARERLMTDVEDTRKEREELRNEIRSLQDHARDQTPVPAAVPPLSTRAVSPASPEDAGAYSEHQRVLSILTEIWASLPSVETRAKVIRKSSKSGKSTSPKGGATQHGTTSSISELDVRSLKALYGTPPPEPSPEEFTVDAFAARVRSLVVDDRALVERLVRFAQGHDLLKSNAERAQKLAQESTVGLDTYQKQVKTLVEQNTTLNTAHAALMDEVNQLQDALELSLQQKRELEDQTTEQAHALQGLQETNSKLSSRSANLVNEATVPSSDADKLKLETRVAQLTADLSEAKDDVDRIRHAEQAQKIQLLDELNATQTEISQLRTQIRLEQQKNGR